MFLSKDTSYRRSGAASTEAAQSARAVSQCKRAGGSILEAELLFPLRWIRWLPWWEQGVTTSSGLSCSATLPGLALHVRLCQLVRELAIVQPQRRSQAPVKFSIRSRPHGSFCMSPLMRAPSC